MTNPRPITYTSARLAYLTADAFAEHFGISRMAAYRLCHAGDVKWLRVGRSMRIPVTELERYTKAAEQAAADEVWGPA